MRIKTLLILSLLLLVVFPAQAQDPTPDAPGTFELFYDEVVQQSITQGGFYDTWRLQANAGDVMVAYMTGYDGLAPFLAILDPGSDALVTSEPAEVNGSVSVEWTVVQAGIYTIYASRVDDQYGTTTGTYELQVRNANPAPLEVDPYDDAVFQCLDFEAANVLSVDFGDDADQASTYRISVYGLDGFQPVIRVFIPQVNINDCSRDGRYLIGDTLTLPNDVTYTVPDGEGTSAARLSLIGAERMGIINLIVGSAYRTSGRYVVVIEGLHVGTNDGDSISIINGPYAASSPLLVYMVRAQNSRVDPFMQTFTSDGTLLTCDDAGRRSCVTGVPAFRDASIAFTDGVSVVGTRFDAGLLIAPGLGERLTIDMTSFEYRTTGEYALVIMGEMPAAQ